MLRYRLCSKSKIEKITHNCLSTWPIVYQSAISKTSRGPKNELVNLLHATGANMHQVLMLTETRGIERVKEAADPQEFVHSNKGPSDGTFSMRDLHITFALA